MFKATDTKHAPWYIVRSDDKRQGAPQCHRAYSEPIPHKKIKREKVKLPGRPEKGRYDDQAGLKDRRFVMARY